MAELVVVIGRFLRIPDDEIGDEGRDHIDGRFQTIRQKCDGPVTHQARSLRPSTPKESGMPRMRASLPVHCLHCSFLPRADANELHDRLPKRTNRAHGVSVRAVRYWGFLSFKPPARSRASTSHRRPQSSLFCSQKRMRLPKGSVTSITSPHGSSSTPGFMKR